MTYNIKGLTYTYANKTFTIGGAVITNATSTYPGLRGVITEIRDDIDIDTENQTPDIYCSFELPILPHEVESIEEKAIYLYQGPKKITELGLDMIVMSPDEVDMLPEKEDIVCSIDVFLLMENWAKDNDYGQSESLFCTLEEATDKARELVSEFKAEDLDEWFSDPKFTEESSDMTYVAYIDGEYESNHYELEIVQSKLQLTPSVIEQINDRYQTYKWRKTL